MSCGHAAQRVRRTSARVKFNQQNGRLFSRFVCLLSHFSSLRIHFGVLLKQNGRLLSHFSSLRIHFDVLLRQNGRLLSHFSSLRIHFDVFRKQNGR
jgi:hypothetical protein